MKKTFFALSILFSALFMAHQASAQFAFGVKLGYNASKLSTNLDTISSSLTSGFHAGVFARIGKRVHLQPEVYYTMSGGTFENDGVNTANDWKQKVTVGTLDIPLLLGISLIESDVFKWRIMAGPQVSFLVNSKIEDLSLTGPIEKSSLRTTSWFIQAGTGFDILFLTLDLKYQGGLNSLIGQVTDDKGRLYPIDSNDNRFVVSLGFKIL
jgi:hypothetical protein